MGRIFVLFAALLTAQVSFAQIPFKVTVKDQETRQPVVGAKVSVKDTEVSAVTDADGVALLTNVSDGEQTVEIFSAGYETRELRVTFPPAQQGENVVFIKVTNELGEVTVVETTRTGREIDDVPTRVGAIDEEEVDEKMNMRPSNVSMVLNESTGIKVQQTSATTQTQSVRIQGLDGRYTQILKDGFPAFGGFSGSLSLLDILPLDLRQVEIVKGPAATFYGFANAGRPVRSAGFETNVRASYDFVKLFAGYTFTDAKAKYLTGDQILPLTPKSKINSALLFEKEEDFKAGVEAYYTK